MASASSSSSNSAKSASQTSSSISILVWSFVMLADPVGQFLWRGKRHHRPALARGAEARGLNPLVPLYANLHIAAQHEALDFFVQGFRPTLRLLDRKSTRLN